MNILHLESSPGWGGQEIRILKESLGMKKRGYNVILAVEKNGGLVKKAREAGFEVYEIRFKKIFWFISFFKILKIILKHKINLLNTHSSSDSWLGGIIARLFNLPVIRTRHLSTNIKKGLNSKLLYGYLADFVVTTCSEIINIISKQARKDLEKCKCIPTGLDVDKIKVTKEETLQFRKKNKLKKEDFLVGTVCFMRSWKGIEDFLKAAQILQNFENIKFLIIGGGHSEKYKELAKKLSLNNVIFTEHLDNPFPAINSLDIFSLLSTAHEGISQASLQAAYLKKPLITTPTGGLKEICIDNHSGLQVPIFSPEVVSNSILHLYNNKSLRNRLGQNAREISEKFSIKNMLDEMDNIYISLQKKYFSK